MRTMPNLMVAIVLGTVSVLVVNAVQAAVVEVEVTLKSVDVKARGITVVYETKLGQKTIELDVSRKAEIAVNGKEGSLDSLKPGQKAKVTYEKELQVVTKIDAEGTSTSSAHVDPFGSGVTPDKSSTKKSPGNDGTASRLPDEWVDLFDGTDLEGWEVQFPPKNAEQSDPCWCPDPERKVLRNSGRTNNWIATVKDYQDFWLQLEWRFAPGGQIRPNGAGVVVRSTGVHSKGLDPRGVQVKFINNDQLGGFMVFGTPLKSAKGEALGEGPNRLYPLVEAKQKSIGQWNTCDVLCDGDKIMVRVNGEIVNRAEGARANPGRICLRSQNTEIEFRNVRIRAVPKTTVKSEPSP